MSCHYKPLCEHYKNKKIKYSDQPISPDHPIGPDRNRKRTALIIIDVQNEFVDKQYESLLAIKSINRLIGSDKFDYLVYTQDIHHHDDRSFASTHGRRPYDVIGLKNHKNEDYDQVLWPDHCLLGTKPSHLHDDLSVPVVLTDKNYDNLLQESSQTHKIRSFEMIGGCSDKLAQKSYLMLKGIDRDVDSYSVFKNSFQKETGLTKFLLEKGVRDIYICGMGRDFCAWWSAVDASSYVDQDTMKPTFNVFFVLDATLPAPTKQPQLIKNLPDYDPTGSSLHQQAVAKFGRDLVYGDLRKNNIINNRWVDAFLKPYQINTVNWNMIVDTDQPDHIDDATSGNIFTKPNEKSDVINFLTTLFGKSRQHT
jgi:nicotinamidase/pyrazinamidase